MEDSKLRFDEDYFHWIRIVLTNHLIKVGIFLLRIRNTYFVNSSSGKWKHIYFSDSFFVGKFRNEL